MPTKAKSKKNLLTVDIVRPRGVWHVCGRRTRGAIAATLAAQKKFRFPKDTPVELSVILTDDRAIRTLNRRTRGKDKATNVLSFPLHPAPDAPVLALGDIVLAAETLKREAKAENKPFLHHFTHLIVHGTLHLLGYDHERPADARHMEQLEVAILHDLGIPDPYIPRPEKSARAKKPAPARQKGAKR